MWNAYLFKNAKIQFFRGLQKNMYFCISKNGRRSIAGSLSRLREESPGNNESPYFLTGRDTGRKYCATASATETKPPKSFGNGKGANAR